MRKLFLFSILLSVTVIAAFCQSPLKAIIRLKDGKTIEAFHFGRLKCESNAYASNYITLKGKYNGNHTEISDFKDISKLMLSGFTASPAPSVGNQKGKINVVKKNGVNVTLDDAELVLSCYNPSDKYNEIHVQMVNPLTDQKVDLSIEMKNIESITF